MVVAENREYQSAEVICTNRDINVGHLCKLLRHDILRQNSGSGLAIAINRVT